jgi:hypothetical protein
MAIQQGDIIIAQVDEISEDHDKFFIIAAISASRNQVALVFINTRINVKVFPSPELQALHHKVLQSNYDFLTHDSWVDCSNITEMDYAEVDEFVTQNPQCHKGLIKNKDLRPIMALLGSSNNNITPKKKRTFGF